MIERNQIILKDIKRDLLTRDFLLVNGLALAQTHDEVGFRYNSIVKHGVTRGIFTDSCGLYLLPSDIFAGDTPVTYRAINGRRWEICVNPNFIELNLGQQRIALAYAASRAYLEAKIVSLKLNLPDEKLNKGISRFLVGIRNLNAPARAYFDILQRGS